MTLPYTELSTASVCAENLIDLIPDIEFRKVYGDNEVATLSAETLLPDSNIYNLVKHFGIDIAAKISIFRLRPNTCYYWHVDGIRSGAINLLLSGYDSFTLFGTKKGVLMENLVKVPYRANTYFLLDTSIYHSVYNFSEMRYLLSIGIPKQYTISEVKEYIRANNV